MKTEHEVLVAMIENLTELRQRMLLPNENSTQGICRSAMDGLHPSEQSVASVMLKAEFARMGLDPVYPVTVDDAALLAEYNDWLEAFLPEIDSADISFGEWLFESSDLPLWGDDPYGDARRLLLNRVIGNLVLSLQTNDDDDTRNLT